MAERVGPTGRVLGIDTDASLGALAVEMLHGDGHRQCAFREHDLSQAAAVPGGPFDLIYARLLLFHLPQRVEALARLWEAVAPGGHLIVQDYDFRSIGVLPDLTGIGELTRVFTAAFIAAGADVHVGARLPELFRRAGAGAPDGTDVAGYLDPLPAGSAMMAQVFRSVLPVALAHGITTEEDAAATLAAAEQDAARYPGGRSCGRCWSARGSARSRHDHHDSPPAGLAPEAGSPVPGPVDVGAIRGHFEFPAAGRVVTNNAASTQPPRELLALYRSLAPAYENVHRGQSSASLAMTGMFEESYDTIAPVHRRAGPAQHRDVPEHDRGHQRGHVLAAHRVPRRRQRGHHLAGAQLQLRPLARAVP